MKSMILFFINIIFSIIPLTRFFKLKVFLLKLSGITLEYSTRIISSARIVYNNVEIGKDTFIGHQVLITGNVNYKINIGDNVDIAPRVCILSGTHEIDMIGNHSAGKGSGANVKIADGVWIGANSTILPGVSIGKKSIIGAGSVVTKDVPEFCIAYGNPAKPVKFWNHNTKSF